MSAGLNSDQRQAVHHNNGPLMILAGAGSGKTKTLVSKISYLIEQLGISPYKILALTFSNKAAKEMRERVARDVSSDIGALQVTTFHAFCAKVLRSEATYLGLGRNFTIYDTSESKTIAKGILSRRGISTKETSPFELLYYFQELKNRGHYIGRDNDDPDSPIDFNDIFYEYFQEYESELRKSNALDFGGLITGVLQLFREYPEVLNRYQDRYEYLLVDEYQDTNRGQFELITLLSAKQKNICVVGDEDQSIYSWRGADIRNILDFEETFKDATILRLEQNYRSSRKIIEAASAVITRNTQRKGKTLWTENPEGDDILIVECASDKDEGRFIADELHRLNQTGVEYREMAVFYRTNAQSRLIEDHLRRLRIPYRIVGGIKFYERKEVKDLLAYMRLITNDLDSLAFGRIINVPARGVGATTLRKLEGQAIHEGISLWEIGQRIVDQPEEYSSLKLSARVRSALKSFFSLLNEAKIADRSGALPSEVYQKILNESGYWEQLQASRDYESQARMENLDELLSAIVQYEQSVSSPRIEGFLETITLDATNEEIDGVSSGEVCLMTIHGAKGLEFEYVFVSGCEENLFPSFQSIENGELAIEEERRLFYVAMTRAMKKLYLTFAQGRMLFGQLKFNGHSRFLDEIPDKYYVWQKPNGKVAMSLKNSDEDFQQYEYEEFDKVYSVGPKSSIPKVEKIKKTYPPGSLVAHSLYGEGKVLDCEGLGQEEKVVIQFKDGAKKKFLVKYAPLTLL